MKFADYINEKNASGNYKLSRLIEMNYIPLSTPMMDRLGYSYEEEAYHMTDIQYLESLKDLQGSKKQISAFTIGGNELMKLPSNPTVIVKLEGNLVIDAASDMWTLIDEAGRRWIALSDSKSDEGTKYSEKLAFFVQGIKDKLVKGLGYTVGTKIADMTKSDRNKLYKTYMDEVEKYLEKGGYKLLNAHLKENITYSYNEVIMNKIKITGAYSLNNDGKQQDIINNKIKYLGVMSSHELANIGK